MSGVPRNTHTITFVKIASGFIRDIDPKDMTSPSGMAPASVRANSFSVCKKPTLSA